MFCPGRPDLNYTFKSQVPSKKGTKLVGRKGSQQNRLGDPILLPHLRASSAYCQAAAAAAAGATAGRMSESASARVAAAAAAAAVVAAAAVATVVAADIAGHW